MKYKSKYKLYNYLRIIALHLELTNQTAVTNNKTLQNLNGEYHWHTILRGICWYWSTITINKSTLFPTTCNLACLCPSKLWIHHCTGHLLSLYSFFYRLPSIWCPCTSLCKKIILQTNNTFEEGSSHCISCSISLRLLWNHYTEILKHYKCLTLITSKLLIILFHYI